MEDLIQLIFGVIGIIVFVCFVYTCTRDDEKCDKLGGDFVSGYYSEGVCFDKDGKRINLNNK